MPRSDDFLTQMIYLNLLCTKVYIMYFIIEDAFLRYPLRKKVAELFLKYGLRIDAKGSIYCGGIGLSPAKIGRALHVDRRVVIKTAQMIASVKELSDNFSGLVP